MPILSGSVVLVQRRADFDTDINYDYNDNNNANGITNDNIDLAGGYYNPEDQSSYDSTNQNNYYDPYYGYNNYNGYYDNTNNLNDQAGRGLTFGDASFYFGNWVEDAGGMIDRASKTIKRFVYKSSLCLYNLHDFPNFFFIQD